MAKRVEKRAMLGGSLGKGSKGRDFPHLRLLAVFTDLIYH
jgi:hypothetical protein